MASAPYQATIRFFSTLLLLGISAVGLACGWGYTAETLRLAFFRAEVAGMDKFRWFYYSSESFFPGNPAAHNDRNRNCREWRTRMGAAVTEADIYTIQYETEPAVFEMAYKEGTLEKAFPKNTFIKALLLPKNKPLLEYMAAAKRLEHSQLVTDSGWESWDTEKEEPSYEDDILEKPDVSYFGKTFDKTTDPFLKQRCAFMLVRFADPKTAAHLYDTQFANSKSILQIWALYFTALSTPDKPLQNYYLSLVFDQSDDKMFNIMQNFNRSDVRESLKYAKNNHEKAVLLAMYSFRNPGPALDEISEIYSLDPESPYINVLLAREINKLEDWVLSPEINNDTPTVSSTGKYVWELKARDENLKNDKIYLAKFRKYLTGIYGTAAASQKDFIAGAIAHLCYMEDDVAEGKRFAAQISDKANPSVLAQKELELALVTLKEQGLHSAQAQDKLVDAINAVCTLAEKDRTLLKGVYTLLSVLSKEYERGGDIATAGLLYRQRENYANMNSQGRDGEMEYWFDDLNSADVHYFYIDYFDEHANTTADIDALLNIIDKKDKTRFEAFICRGTLTDRNMYLDLKGTIAFRQDNLQLAYEVFSLIPESFYKTKYEFANFLNEDPFFPRILLYKFNKKEGYYAYAQTNYKYDFNKARFVKQLIDLKLKNDAASFMKLAHAYFNVSRFGNAWMMNSYSSGWRYYGTNEEFAGQNGDINYNNLKLSIHYYKNVLQSSKDNEQLALTSLMLHKCHYLLGFSDYEEYSPPFTAVYKGDAALVDFYTKYRNTKVFKTYNCPMLESFLK